MESVSPIVEVLKTHLFILVATIVITNIILESIAGLIKKTSDQKFINRLDNIEKDHAAMNQSSNVVERGVTTLLSSQKALLKEIEEVKALCDKISRE